MTLQTTCNVCNVELSSHKYIPLYHADLLGLNGPIFPEILNSNEMYPIIWESFVDGTLIIYSVCTHKCARILWRHNYLIECQLDSSSVSSSNKRHKTNN